MARNITVKTTAGTITIPGMPEIGRRLEEFRAVTGKNKKEFAEFIGTTAANYQHLINGKSYPRFEVLAILKYHGYDISGILTPK